MKAIINLIALLLLVSCGGSGGGGEATVTCKAFKSVWERSDGEIVIDLSSIEFSVDNTLQVNTEDDAGVFTCYYNMILIGDESSGRLSLDYLSSLSNLSSERDTSCVDFEGIENYTMTCNNIEVCDQDDENQCVNYR
jgi:hypothetical protein